MLSTIVQQIFAIINPHQNPPEPPTPTCTESTAHLSQAIHCAAQYLSDISPKITLLPPPIESKEQPSLTTSIDFTFNPHDHVIIDEFLLPLDTWRLHIELSPAHYPYTRVHASLVPLDTPCLDDITLDCSHPEQTPRFIPLILPTQPVTTSTAMGLLLPQALMHQLSAVYSFEKTPHPNLPLIPA